jgi:Tol biopolymer transport system component
VPFLRLKTGLFVIITILSGCTGKPHGTIAEINEMPVIDPDYNGIIIPCNIAPLNFKVSEAGKRYFVRLSSDSGISTEIQSGNGIIKIPVKKWKRFLDQNIGKKYNTEIYVKDKNGKWSKYKTINNTISEEPIDPYITYRLLYPGYESWNEISIKQRDLENFNERSIIENSVADQNCVNCHSFNNGRTDDFLFHMRGSHGGTYFYNDGDFRKINLKTAEMKNGAVYPRWHPSGKFVAFSSNKIIQQFHAVLNKKVEVSDLESSLLLYDVRNNLMHEIKLPDMEKYMDTYPEWSSDGRYLYFCRTNQVPAEFDYQDVHYNLYRVPFDSSTISFGEPELVFDASAIGKSISFPRISPDGKFLVLTVHNYGCFPIWHKEADLWTIDLRTFEAFPLSLNSDMTDSYHSWSSNGSWLVFSSKRIDGRTARFFISYIDEDGHSGKPFILPQKDPEFYGRFLKSFNLPELSTLKIDADPGKMRRISFSPSVQAGWSGN